LLDSPDAYQFEDGTKPETPSIVEVSQVVHQNAVWLGWQPGDLVVADNTRMMHAREAFEDSHRRILVRYSAFTTPKSERGNG
jgi:alpha-ketoglutarate-dependent taurine dioxygenase